MNFPVSEKPNKKIIQLAESLLKLNKQLQSTKLDTQRQQIQRTIAHSEKKIKEFVYDLYGLTEVEIEIIEKS